MARTRIVATLGPATDDECSIGALLDAGVNVVRLNFSHGSHSEHGRRIQLVRRLTGARPVAILQDLGGPKLRLAHRVAGRPGDVVEIRLPATVQAGDPVLLADGLMQLEVIDASRSRVVTAGDVPPGKGVNLPSSRLDLPPFTDKDRTDLHFGVAQGVDAVALSFVEEPSDLDEARACGLPVIAKIERARAIQHLDALVEAADGILVARGDLGVEIPIEGVPMLQKRLVQLANQAAKPVIVATQMLRSMVTSRLPTRAEATDVANAVLDGADAVMLSEETAIGDWPVEAVRVMDRILGEAEPHLEPRGLESDAGVPGHLAHAACALAGRLEAAAIVVVTRSGFTARQVARHRPRVPIVALTPDEVVRRRLSLVWGVTAVTIPWYPDTDTLLARFRDAVRPTALVADGARVVITAGWPITHPGITNLVHVATM